MRILLTRAQEDSERTARRLALLGHESVIAPVTRIVPTVDPKPPGSWDSLIVTSAHGEAALQEVADKDCLVFAVGDRTALAVRQAGFSSVMVADGDAVSLSALIRDRLEPGRTLLHVAARHHKDEPAASLRAAGFRIITWEAYEAEAVESLPDDAIRALRAGQVEAVLHYSRRSADLFLRLAKEANLSANLAIPLHVCLSSDVAVPFDALGLSTRVAARPHEDALLATLR